MLAVPIACVVELSGICIDVDTYTILKIGPEPSLKIYVAISVAILRMACHKWCFGAIVQTHLLKLSLLAYFIIILLSDSDLITTDKFRFLKYLWNFITCLNLNIFENCHKNIDFFQLAEVRDKP